MSYSSVFNQAVASATDAQLAARTVRRHHALAAENLVTKALAINSRLGRTNETHKRNYHLFETIESLTKDNARLMAENEFLKQRLDRAESGSCGHPPDELAAGCYLC